MEKPYTVIAILDAKPGKEKELHAALVAVVKPSRAEEACLEYKLHRNINQPGQFILFEIGKIKKSTKSSLQNLIFSH